MFFGACSQKVLKSNLDNASDKMFDFDCTYYTVTRLLNCKLLSVSNLTNFKQCVQLDICLFTMALTDWLSQKIMTLVLIMSGKCPHVKKPATRANNSKNSMLGFSSDMNCSPQVPTIG